MNDKKENIVKFDSRKDNGVNKRHNHSFRHRLGQILCDAIMFDNQNW